MKIVIGILIIILASLQIRLWTGAGSYAEIARLNDSINVQIEENESLDARNNSLYVEVTELKSGMDAIEERARHELGLIRRGETFYLIVDE